MLTLEQCKALADRGLPQGIRKFEQYWAPDASGLVDGYDVYRNTTDDLIPADYKWWDGKPRYRIPDLEVLMEFAGSIRPSGWFLSPVPGQWPTWRITDQLLGVDHDDDDPKQAVYKLIEKHFEKVKR